MQGVRILRNEAYLWYVAMTKDEAQRRRWTFYEAVTLGPGWNFVHMSHEPKSLESPCKILYVKENG